MEIRKKIDFIDSKILKLLNDRMEQVLMAKKFKSQIEDRQREKEVFERIRENLTGLINAEFIEKIYTEIIKESKELQQGDYQLIAFQGEHGAYGDVAITSSSIRISMWWGRLNSPFTSVCLHCPERTTGRSVPYTLIPKPSHRPGNFFRGTNWILCSIMIRRVQQECWRRRDRKGLPPLQVNFVQSSIILKRLKKI
jgi:chorismate mutase